MANIDDSEFLIQDSNNEDLPSTSSKKKNRAAGGGSDKKVLKPGIIYLSTIPYFMTVKSIRHYFAKYGDLGRVFLQVERRINKSGRKEKHYTEGWIEFKSKDLAKRVAASLNNTMVGGKRRSKAYDALWNIKYLHGFKWVHLNEQLAYEKAVFQQKLRTEISQAKRQANYFADQIEKGENLKRLEEKVLKKGGLWNEYQRQLKQTKGVSENKDKKRKKNADDKQGELLGMIFAGENVEHKKRKTNS